MSLPEEDLTCPVCFDIFRDPVLLSCSHSFCRSCLKQCWDTRVRECPVCRRKASKSPPPSNLALKNVCEALQQVRRQITQEEHLRCSLHGEKLKLFCLNDEQPICVVCQGSKLHKNHDCSPVEEAFLDCKNKLELFLKSLQSKMESLKMLYRTSADMSTYIKYQTLETQRKIKSQFEQLHQALHDEESARTEAVKKEEEERITAVKEKMNKLSAEMLSVTETMSAVEKQLKEDDLNLLKNFKATQDRDRGSVDGLDDMSGLLIDVTKHLSNLKYRVLEKILDNVGYSPVILDPSTAHPCLILSEDLTSLHYSKQPSCCHDNPERFHVSAEVVGMSSLGSGSHHWIVETGSNKDWLLGVASLSAPRNTEVAARPENGFWTICFREGELRAMSSPPTLLTVKSKPEQVKVQLDCSKGTVSFSDPVDHSLLYEFTQTFTEPLLPYFYTQSTKPLRIMPEKVIITVLQQ
ncbi:nuclear factor 7, brain isoform X1 [Cyprinodon tularosa]|uniref:nuclear factor 7, brain isoform X1 n=1 Tax=Cyprinodon tularosa TaxID=77115 RepID=UPI0018E21B6B|nr:nuclear factor 7, brain isoform X1 [Cyprinodon tularosa]